MADKLHITTEWLEETAAQLSEVQRALNDAVRRLGNVTLRDDEGGEMTYRLSGTFGGKGVSAGTVRQAITALRAASGAVGDDANDISKASRTAARRFEDAQREIERRIQELTEGMAASNAAGRGASGTRSSGENKTGADEGDSTSILNWISPNGKIIDPRAFILIPPHAPTYPYKPVLIPSGWKDGFDPDEKQTKLKALTMLLHYPEDTSKWTKEMREEYLKKLANTYTYTDEKGRTSYVFDDGSVTIMSATGVVLATTRYAFTPTSQTMTHTASAGDGGPYTKQEVTVGPSQLGYQNDDMFGVKDAAKNLKRDIGTPTKNYYQNGQKVKEVKMPERRATIYETGVDYSDSVSVLHTEGVRKDGKTTTSVTADVGKASFSAGGHGGFYSYKIDQETGQAKRYFAPGVSADAGVSISAIEGKATKSYSVNDSVKVNGEIGTKMMSGGVKAQGQFGYVNKSIAAGGGVSAEMNVAEVNGSIGGEAFGVEGKIGGKVTFGVGGHANVGYYDGTFKVDIGVSAGIGAGVSMEVNATKLIDNIIEGSMNSMNNLITSARGTARSLFNW
ncbi:MAG: hypothetical protein IJ234_08385 [Clostridia bacterium]|nr:hypothetical protein [Clostridia bacterium]